MTGPQLSPAAHPPETLEGWYALHQIYALDHAVLSAVTQRVHPAESARVQSTRGADEPADANAGRGWSAYAALVGSTADLMAVHFRPSLELLADAQRESQRRVVAHGLRLVYSFLSVTEAGLYHLTAQLAREAAERGGAVGDEKYAADLAARIVAERESPNVKRRLYPPLPDAMPYVSFYPMTKRRDAGQNWYSLSLDERSRLMYAHGLTGRRYAGRVTQIISGAIGLDAWEWGVTLFAKDPLDLKKLVTDMRFDEVSAKYADFGDFYVGKVIAPEALQRTLETFSQASP